MATLITKNSSTASAVPAAGDLVKGELAVNVTDKKVYTKDNSAAVVKLVGSLGNQEANAVAITGGAINGTTIGATTPSTGAFTTASASGGFTGNLTGNVTGNVSGTAANVTGVVAIANGGTGLSALGTGVQTALGQAVTGSGSFVLSTSPSLTTPNLGTPSAAVLTNATGLPLTTGVTGTLGVANGGTGITAFGTGVATALGQNVTGSGGIVLATSPSLTTPNLGTPSAATLTNATGLPISTGVSGLGTGVATALAVNTGSAGAFVVNGGALGTPSSGTLTNATGLPISTGVSGLGTGVATALAVNTGSAGAFVVNGGALGTPSSGTLTNATGLPLSTGVTGTLAVANGGTGQTSYTDGQLLIGNTATGSLSKATLTAGTNVTITNGNGTITIAATGGGGGTPGGSNTQVQYNNAGAFAGSANMTFDGTSLTLGGNPTLSAGTANGVAYLNGSKALTTGSALTFDGTNFATTGRVTANDFVASGSAYYTTVGGTTYGSLIATAGTLTLNANNGTGLIFSVASSEGMRLTSTGLGIGTSSPGAKLDVSGSNAGSVLSSRILNTSTSASSDAQQFIYVNSGTAGDPYTTWTVGGVTSWSAGIRNSDSDNWYLSPGGNLATSPTLVATTSGNLGLGVTPSAWSLLKAFDIGASGALYAYTTQVGVTNNAYFDGTNYRYKYTGAAAYYRINAGTSEWYTAPSGTAGNAISFTQALTLNANGALVLQGGNTSASGVGVAFPATQSASSNANTLDDYEEGTFTLSNGGNTTYTTRSGRYTKIGNFVKCCFFHNINTIGTGSATTLTGLPFAASSTAPTINGGVVTYVSGLAVSALAIGVYADSAAQIIFMTRNANDTNATTQLPAVMGNSFAVYAEVSYLID